MVSCLVKGMAHSFGGIPMRLGLGAIRGKTRFHDRVEVGHGTAAFKGKIGDFQLYNRALNGDEVSTLATLSVEEPNEPVDISLNLAIDTAVEGTNEDLITASPEIAGTISGGHSTDSNFGEF